MALARTGPKDAVLGLNSLVGNARIVRDAAGTRPPQLVEDLPRAGEREPLRPAEGTGDVLDDPPVLAGVAGTVDRLIDLDDPALRRADDALILLVQRTRKHHVGVPGRLGQEEVDG